MNTASQQAKPVRKSFVMAYRAIFDDERLRAIDRECYFTILPYFNKKHGGAYIGEERIAAHMGKSRYTVIRCLANLENAGWIQKHNCYDIRRGKVTSNWYTFPIQYPDIPVRLFRNRRFVTLKTSSNEAAKHNSNVANLPHTNVANLPHDLDLDPYQDLGKFPLDLGRDNNLDEYTPEKTEGDSQDIFDGEQNLGAMEDRSTAAPESSSATTQFSGETSSEEGRDLSDAWFIEEDSPASSSSPGAESSTTPLNEPPTRHVTPSRTEAQAQAIVRRLVDFTHVDDQKILHDWQDVLERRIRKIGFGACNQICDWILHRHWYGAPYKNRASTLAMDKVQYPHLVFLLYGEKTYAEFLAFAQEWRANEPETPFIRRYSYFDTPPASVPASQEESIQYCRKIAEMLTFKRSAHRSSPYPKPENTIDELEDIEEETLSYTEEDYDEEEVDF